MPFRSMSIKVIPFHVMPIFVIAFAIMPFYILTIFMIPEASVRPAGSDRCIGDLEITISIMTEDCIFS